MNFICGINPVLEALGAATRHFDRLLVVKGAPEQVMVKCTTDLIAIPVGLGIAVFLTEICPLWLRRPIGLAIELLAGIPSII